MGHDAAHFSAASLPTDPLAELPLKLVFSTWRDTSGPEQQQIMIFHVPGPRRAGPHKVVTRREKFFGCQHLDRMPSEIMNEPRKNIPLY